MFAHPLMLAWTAAAAVPLVLRLAGRAADRTVDFSGLLFLTGGPATAATGGRARDWVLLATRSAALGLLAVAAARPTLPAAWAGVPTAGLSAADRVAVAVVIDDAAGTAYAHGGPTRFEQVRAAGLDLIGRLGRGDRAVIVPDPVPANWPAGGRASADLAGAAVAVQRLRPLRRPADVAAALTRAADALADETGPRAVVVVCDREAVAWQDVTDGFGRAWRGRSPPRVVVVPVGGEASDNVSVASVAAVAPPLVRDVAGAVRVTVRNWGPDPVAAVPLWVWSGTAPLGEATVALPANGSAVVDVPVTLARAGPRVVSAAIRRDGAGGGWRDGLAFDDRRDGVVDVVPPARVLLVTDDPAAAGPLRAAMAPRAAVADGVGDPAVVTVVGTDPWVAPSTARTDVVVLADVADVGGPRAADLRRFVADGGGLLVAPGRRVSAAEYDSLLGGAAGLLPADLSGPRPTRGGGVVRLAGVDHPVLGFADGVGSDPAAGVRLDRAFGLGPRPAGRVLATVDGRPAVVAAEGPGRGRVLLTTFPLADGWGRLTRSGLFVPLVQSAVRWLAGGGVDPADHEGVLGRPIVVRVDGAVDERSATVQQLPGVRRDPVRVERRGVGSELRTDRPAALGTYRLRYRVGGRERSTLVVVSPPADASDLTPLSAADWQAVARRVGFERADAGTAAAAVTAGRGGPDGWAVGVAGVLALLIGETLLGRRWSGAVGRRVG